LSTAGQFIYRIGREISGAQVFVRVLRGIWGFRRGARKEITLRARLNLSFAIENDRANDQEDQLQILRNPVTFDTWAQDVIERLVLNFFSMPFLYRRAALKLSHTNAHTTLLDCRSLPPACMNRRRAA
jgi:hypothetical protein